MRRTPGNRRGGGSDKSQVSHTERYDIDLSEACKGRLSLSELWLLKFFVTPVPVTHSVRQGMCLSHRYNIYRHSQANKL